MVSWCSTESAGGPEVRSRVELFEAIRRDHRREDLSIRQLAEKYKVHRRRKTPERAAPKLDRVAPLIDVMLREDLTAPRKQQHTARRVLARLVDEHQITDVSYWTVRDYVAKRRPEIAARSGAGAGAGLRPAVPRPGR